jgi:hypothetical protein
MKYALYQTRNQDLKVELMMAFNDYKLANLVDYGMIGGLYTHVANIHASNFEEVFEIGNIGPECDIERLERMHSVSVGDVIVAEDGTMVVVADVGFVAFGHNIKLAA